MENYKLEFGDKSIEYMNGIPYRIRVTLRSTEGMAYYPIFLDLEDNELNDYELYQKALNIMYARNFQGRYEDEKFKEYDKAIQQLKIVSNTLIRTATLPDVVRTEIIKSYPVYAEDVFYKQYDVVDYGGTLYEVLKDHQSQRDWKPDTSTTYYRLFLKPKTR